MIKTKKGNPNRPVRAMIYGVEGVGKSTLGAKSDNPIFITPEGGTDRLTDSKGNPIDEMPNILTWDDVRNAVRMLATEAHVFETVVLDSADWIEKLCHAQIIGKSGKSITTCNGGYGAGYRQSEIMHKELIDDLAVLRERRGMNVIITAHAAVRIVKDPSMPEDYESFEIKCHEMVSSLYREWVDVLLFARFRTFVNPSSTQKARAISDGTRVAYASKQPSFQAKNRYGMPAELPFTEDFWNVLNGYARVDPAKVRAEILGLREKVSPEKLAVVDKTITDAGNDPNKLAAILKRLKEVTK